MIVKKNSWIKFLVVFVYLSSWSCSVKNTPESILDRIYKNKEFLNLCQGEIDTAISQQSSAVFPLKKNQYLLEILCFRGAYQNNYQYLIYTQKNGDDFIKPLQLESLEISKDGKMAKQLNSLVGGLAEYQNQEKSLLVISKYRGLGDCGAMAKYQLINEELKLVEYRVKAACDGKYLEPEQYTKFIPLSRK